MKHAGSKTAFTPICVSVSADGSKGVKRQIPLIG